MPDITTTFQAVDPKYLTLIDMVSHELKSPLTTIKIFAEVLQKDLSPNTAESGNKYLSKIDDKVNQLTGFINDYSDLVKIKSGSLVFNDSRHVYPRLLTTLLNNINKQHPFNYKTENVVECLLVVDPKRIQQALSKFIFHLLRRLSTEHENIQIVSLLSGNELVANILNPPRNVSLKEYQPVHPSHPAEFYDDIEVTLANAVVQHYGGQTQLFLHPDFGYVFSLSLPAKV